MAPPPPRSAAAVAALFVAAVAAAAAGGRRVAAHSHLDTPRPMTTKHACRMGGSPHMNCPGPCPTEPSVSWASQATYKRGERYTVKWARNNHEGMDRRGEGRGRGKGRGAAEGWGERGCADSGSALRWNQGTKAGNVWTGSIAGAGDWEARRLGTWRGQEGSVRRERRQLTAPPVSVWCGALPAHFLPASNRIDAALPRTAGGFTRLTLVPKDQWTSKAAHAERAFWYSCWTAGRESCPASDKDQGGGGRCYDDQDGSRFGTLMTVPRIVPDGDYVLGYAWYGGMGDGFTESFFGDCTLLCGVAAEGRRGGRGAARPNTRAALFSHLLWRGGRGMAEHVCDEQPAATRLPRRARTSQGVVGGLAPGTGRVPFLTRPPAN